MALAVGRAVGRQWSMGQRAAESGDAVGDCDCGGLLCNVGDALAEDSSQKQPAVRNATATPEGQRGPFM